MDITRRSLLVATGATAALSACRKHEIPVPTRRGPYLIEQLYSGGGNVGDKPNGEAGYYGKPIDFDTNKICLIYVDVQSPPFHFQVARFYFDNPGTSAKMWDDISPTVIKWIDFLNSSPTFPTIPISPPPHPDPPWPFLNGPTAGVYWMGIKDFAFKSQHHLVIYFKTDGIDISDDPLWFGDMLQGEVLQHSNADYQANPNYSFYGAAKTKTTIAGNWPKNILYVRNHYQKRGQYGHGYAPLDPPDVRLYSMNVNLITTAEPGGLTLPLIFDPDTGNMGTGQP